MRREGEDTNKYYKKETNRKEEDKESIWEQCNWCDRGPHSSALPIIKLFGIQTHIPPSLFILIIIHFDINCFKRQKKIIYLCESYEGRFSLLNKSYINASLKENGISKCY